MRSRDFEEEQEGLGISQKHLSIAVPETADY
jgi:hypothetical protein